MKKLFFIILLINFVSSDMLNSLKYRAVENKLYETINKINIIHYYINDFIMNRAKVPTISDLGDRYTQIDSGVSWWPKNYKNTSNITFGIDSNKTYITYTNIFSSIPTDITIVGIYSKNIALKQDAMINLNTLDMIIPLDLKTIKFLKKINDVNITTMTYIENHSESYMACNAVRDNNTLYEANGSGNFDIYFCDNGNGWIIQPIFKLNEYYNSTVTSIAGIDINKTIYTDFNSTVLTKRVILGNGVNSLTNAKRVIK